MLRNLPWTREELILALDLYLNVEPVGVSGKQLQVRELSRVLKKINLVTNRPDIDKFRNENGVSMKLSNFLRLDPSYHGQGLSSGGKLEEVIWDEFASDKQRLREVANAIRLHLEIPEISLVQAIRIDEDEEATEGALLTKMHKYRERNRSIIVKKKKQRIQTDPGLHCEVCGFSFQSAYGPIGDGFIECHHTQPLSQLRPGQSTHLDDLALVCANCHRILHKYGDTLGIVQLSAQLLTSDG